MARSPGRRHSARTHADKRPQVLARLAAPDAVTARSDRARSRASRTSRSRSCRSCAPSGAGQRARRQRQTRTARRTGSAPNRQGSSKSRRPSRPVRHRVGGGTGVVSSIREHTRLHAALAANARAREALARRRHPPATTDGAPTTTAVASAHDDTRVGHGGGARLGAIARGVRPAGGGRRRQAREPRAAAVPGSLRLRRGDRRGAGGRRRRSTGLGLRPVRAGQ